jgi:cation-transporting P-type ATPase F
LPILPVQLLWVNMATALLLGLMLVFEPKERDVMNRPPRDPKTPVMTFPLFMRTGLVTLMITAGAIGLFHWLVRNESTSLEQARTAAVNTVVMVQLVYLWNCRSLIRSVVDVGIFSNRWIFYGCAGMIAAQLLFTYLPLMNRLFHTAPLGLGAWATIIGIAATAFGVVEFEKWVRRNFGTGKT